MSRKCNRKESSRHSDPGTGDVHRDPRECSEDGPAGASAHISGCTLSHQEKKTREKPFSRWGHKTLQNHNHEQMLTHLVP
eukprot:1366741-Rhodomonas_salina.4